MYPLGQPDIKNSRMLADPSSAGFSLNVFLKTGERWQRGLLIPRFVHPQSDGRIDYMPPTYTTAQHGLGRHINYVIMVMANNGKGTGRKRRRETREHLRQHSMHYITLLYKRNTLNSITIWQKWIICELILKGEETGERGKHGPQKEATMKWQMETERI